MTNIEQETVTINNQSDTSNFQNDKKSGPGQIRKHARAEKESRARVTAPLSLADTRKPTGWGLLNISPESSDCLPAYSCAGHRAVKRLLIRPVSRQDFGLHPMASRF